MNQKGLIFNVNIHLKHYTIMVVHWNN